MKSRLLRHSSGQVVPNDQVATQGQHPDFHCRDNASRTWQSSGCSRHHSYFASARHVHQVASADSAMQPQITGA